MDPEPVVMDQKPAAIEREIDETRASLADKVEQLENEVRDTVQNMTEAVGETIDTVKETVGETIDSVKETVQDTVQTVKRTFDLEYQTQQRPWVMFSGSAVAGCLAGWLIGGFRSKQGFIPAPEYSAARPESFGRLRPPTGAMRGSRRKTTTKKGCWAI